MTAQRLAGAGLIVTAFLFSGCASARVVETTSAGGVVAIPANTNSWPFYHRDKAVALMAQNAPDGYEIVREEEAVSGVQRHTTIDKRTKPAPGFVLSGVDMASEDAPGREGPPTRMASLHVPLQPHQEHTEMQTHETEIKEWRIHYRKNVQ